jgi:hypothetical protein
MGSIKGAKLELGTIQDIEKEKSNLLTDIKKHFSNRDSWGAESNKILSQVGDQMRKGDVLKKESDLLDNQLNKIVSNIVNLKSQADKLGVEMPKSLDLLDGKSIRSYGNSFADTNIIIDEFKNRIK